MVKRRCSERRGCRRLLLRVEVLEDRLTPSGPSQPVTILLTSPVGLDANLAAIKAVTLQLDPGLAQVADSLTLAIDLRNFIYQRFALGSTAPSWVYESPYDRFVQAIVVRDEPLLCQGAQIVYADLAQAFGIQARYVAMYANVDDATHATDEVLIAGSWIAMDPTFNVAYVSPTTGQYLCYAQLQAGVPYLVTHNGMPERASRNMKPLFPRFRCRPTWRTSPIHRCWIRPPSTTRRPRSWPHSRRPQPTCIRSFPCMNR